MASNYTPPPKLKKLLAIDCETSGMSFDQEANDITKGFQSVSWGIIVADVETLRPIETLYVEIKWNGVDLWTNGAEKVHGLSREYLEENGLTEEEAAGCIADIIARHFDIEESIVCLGHNVARFDIPFLKKLLWKFGYEFKFAHRSVDTCGMGIVLLDAYDSQQLFNTLHIKRGDVHNALEDIEATLKAARIIRKLFRDCMA